jgi:ABC-type Fe3+/spermidine/putrescine transport system ATPase subunit
MGEMAVEILHGIDLTILRGAYTAIVGSSGSGKSTLMNILGCLEQPSSGQYYFDARDITVGPICRVILPHHIPMGAHACWTPASALKVPA